MQVGCALLHTAPQHVLQQQIISGSFLGHVSHLRLGTDGSASRAVAARGGACGSSVRMPSVADGRFPPLAETVPGTNVRHRKEAAACITNIHLSECETPPQRLASA